MKYTDNQLIKELKYFAEYLGRDPTKLDVTKDSLMPSANTYIKRFGSWNKTKNLLGFCIKKEFFRDEELLSILTNYYTKNQKTPRELDVRQASAIKRRFGSWNNAIVKAGLKPNCDQSHITEENLALSYNKEWLSKENETKTLHEISNDLGYNKHRMSSRFKELDIKPILHKESLKEKEWLDSLGITERQYPIANYKVDGYNPDTNTVYEFLGDYWHGNPEVYDPDDYNKSCSKTFGQLHNETIERLEHIKSLGYNIITKWET